MKVAILIDGSFFQKKFYHANTRNPSPDDVETVALQTMNDNEFVGDILYRVFYYDCYPYNQRIRHPLTGIEIDYSTTPVYTSRTNFLRNLSLKPRVALRSGTLSFSGWKTSYRNVRRLRRGDPFNSNMLEPKLEQKEVDIKIGLDMAWISSRHIADKLVLFTGDSDMIPAMKLARKEGLMVFLVHLGHGVKHGLKEHCDGIIQVAL
jgi:uncharacterized LabA/DUF88 family protein